MSDTDLELVDRVRGGDTCAFGSLVDRYESAVFNAALRIVGDRDDAADVTQSTFVKVYEKIETFDPDYKFFSWLYRISINEAYNLCRKRRQSATLELEPGDPPPGPYQEYRQVEMGEHLRRALAAMSYEYRVVIVLKHLMLLSYREIGVILGLPEKTVKSRLFSGRQILHRHLVKQGYNV